MAWLAALVVVLLEGRAAMLWLLASESLSLVVLQVVSVLLAVAVLGQSAPSVCWLPVCQLLPLLLVLYGVGVPLWLGALVFVSITSALMLQATTGMAERPCASCTVVILGLLGLLQ